MKKVFIDTNVILDFILHREHWAEAKDVVAHFIENRTEMVMSDVVTPQAFLKSVNESEKAGTDGGV